MSRLASIGECMIELSQAENASSKEYHLAYGGDSLNMALYFARWGGDVEYVTALGDDIYSETMYEDWQVEKIGVKLVQKIAGRQSGLYMIQTDDKGERSFCYWRDNSPAREIFEFENCHDLLKNLMTFDYIYFSGITLSLFSEKALDIFYYFLQSYKKNGGRIIFDLNYRPVGWVNAQSAIAVFERFIPLVNMALPSQDDEEKLTGDRSAKRIIEYYSNLGVEEIILKCGSSGCILHHKNITKKITAQIIDNPIDTTAAGDGFNGGYLAARLSGLNPQQAVQYGQKTASLIIQYKGAIVARSDWPEEYKISKN